MREILFFSENKVVLLMYKQNKSGLINYERLVGQQLCTIKNN